MSGPTGTLSFYCIQGWFSFFLRRVRPRGFLVCPSSPTPSTGGSMPLLALCRQTRPGSELSGPVWTYHFVVAFQLFFGGRRPVARWYPLRISAIFFFIVSNPCTLNWLGASRRIRFDWLRGLGRHERRQQQTSEDYFVYEIHFPCSKGFEDMDSSTSFLSLSSSMALPGIQERSLPFVVTAR